MTDQSEFSLLPFAGTNLPEPAELEKKIGAVKILLRYWDNINYNLIQGVTFSELCDVAALLYKMDLLEMQKKMVSELKASSCLFAYNFVDLKPLLALHEACHQFLYVLSPAASTNLKNVYLLCQEKINEK